MKAVRAMKAIKFLAKVAMKALKAMEAMKELPRPLRMLQSIVKALMDHSSALKSEELNDDRQCIMKAVMDINVF